MPKLIIVNGAPGVGKTTLMQHLMGELHIPGIGKDDIKEFLFDHVGVGDRDWSRMLGAASSDMLYIVAEQALIADQTMMIENAFWTEFAKPRLAKLIKKYKADVLEVYCFTDDETRMERFRTRHQSGQRHRGHVDNLATLRDIAQYEPLKLGEVVRIDTTALVPEDCARLTAQIQSFIAGRV